MSINFTPNTSCGPCLYCGRSSEGRPEELLTCDLCRRPLHMACLLQGQPQTTLLGDNLFRATCLVCAVDGRERIVRPDLSTVHILLLIMYNLHMQQEESSTAGFFHRKIHILRFLNEHWKELESPDTHKRKRKMLQNAASSQLAHYSRFFVSGQSLLDVGGWYRLAQVLPPAQIILKDGLGLGLKRPGRPYNSERNIESTNQPQPPSTVSIKSESKDTEKWSYPDPSTSSWYTEKDILTPHSLPPETLFEGEERTEEEEDDDEDDDEEEDLWKNGGGSGYENQYRASLAVKEEIIVKEELTFEGFEDETQPAKEEEEEWRAEEERRKVEEEEERRSAEEEEELLRAEEEEERRKTEEEEELLRLEEEEERRRVEEKDELQRAKEEEARRMKEEDEAEEECDIEVDMQEEEPLNIKIEGREEEEEEEDEGGGEVELPPVCLSLFPSSSSSPSSSPSSFAVIPPVFLHPGIRSPTKLSKNLRRMSHYEERVLLRQLERKVASAAASSRPLPSHLYRLRRKLAVRRQKVEHGLPLFNLDEEVEFLRRNGCVMTKRERMTQQGTDGASIHQHHSTASTARILDRFQVAKQHRRHLEEHNISFAARLGGSDAPPTLIHSPYTLRRLKPYILRDYNSTPLRLQLLREIVSHHHRGDAEWQPPPPHPIDYCYVTPRHIPAMNQLARHFFWPGIDLSEVLQYPDHTCVVLYRHLVVGFGVLVPDTSYNEAYLSFLLVHPEWRRAGIATFILYHLIQTCQGKDVTLHVSATNPALILYQRFGFKVEEFLSNFYDKYLPDDSPECKHAMFMRLSR